MPRVATFLLRLAPVSALCAALLPATLAAREITGELAYRARIALPPDAELAVDLRGPSGTVATLRQAIQGRQVPLPFTLPAQADGDLTLQAAVFVGGQAIWLSDPVAIPSGTDPITLGRVELYRPLAPGNVTRLACGDRPVELRPSGDAIRLQANGRSFDLAPAPAASGARYSDGASPETSLWSRGNRALLRLEGTLLPECLPMIPSALLPFTARGNEPFWSLRVDRDGLQLALPEGKGTTEDLPYSDPLTEGDALIFATDSFTLRLHEGPCRDSMTGMPHPFRATLLRGNEEWPGCAGDPASLLQGDWRATHLDGTPLDPATEITLAFAEGRLAGKAACNRISGSFTLTGESLTVGPLASTRMACPPPMMEAERRTLDALSRVTGFDIDADGRLDLLAADGTSLLTAHR